MMMMMVVVFGRKVRRGGGRTATEKIRRRRVRRRGIVMRVDLVDAGTFVKAGGSVHNLGTQVSPRSNWPSVRCDGEDVRGSPESGDSDPTRIKRKGDILNFGGGFAPPECVEVMYGGKGRTQRMGEDLEYVKAMTETVSREQQLPRLIPRQRRDGFVNVGKKVRH